MNFPAFLVAAACPAVLAASLAAGAAERVRVPSDIELRRGANEVVAKVDECRIRLKIADGDYFWTSPSSADAVFYRPDGKFTRAHAPYLQKPDVETYSGVYWDYIKPRPHDEPWFGVRCTAGTAEPSTYVDAHCPARKNGGAWVLTEAAARLPKAAIEPIAGKGWDGFVVSFESKTPGLRSLTFCAVGANTLMGQASYPSGRKQGLESIKQVLRTVEFVD